MTKGQLLLSEAKNRQYESKISQLEAKIHDLQKTKQAEKQEFILVSQ